MVPEGRGSASARRGNPGPGRPRDVEVDRRVLDAARQILARQGFDGFSVDEIAAQAGVSKSTLYRRWPTRDHLIVASLAAVLDSDAPMADTGTIRGDLVATLTALAAFLNAPGMPRFVAELVALVARHEDIAARIHAATAHRRRSGITLIERAKQRGELRADLDANVFTDQLVGPLYYRLLISGEPIDAAFIAVLVDTALTPALAGP